MIHSQMISFRPQCIQQRDLSKYIKLVQQVYLMLRQSSESFGNVNNIATCIRQVVLKNDCLEEKNDLLDFFFLCEKSVNNFVQNQSKKNCKENKNWTKTVQKKISQLKGMHELYQRQRKIQLKRGLSSLQQKVTDIQPQQPEPQIDSSTILVQDDIRLKTLYFFKWCKFIQYGKSIKKLRLKQIDDLRKSLTFNQYAVKFSYFHNWRKISKMSVANKEIFTKIQTIEKKALFDMTINSFYGLFEIAKIEHKLCEKVKQAILLCNKQKVFRRLAQKLTKQKTKAITQTSFSKNLSLNQVQIQKIKYRFLFHLSEILGTQRPKCKTLSQNLIKSENNYSKLNARTAFICLKNQVIQTRQNISKVKEMRKQKCLENKFQEFTKSKQVLANHESLLDFLRQNKLKRGLNVLNLLRRIKKQIQTNYDNNDQLNQQTSIFSSYKQSDLYKQFEYNKLKEFLEYKMATSKVQKMLQKFRQAYKESQQLQLKVTQTVLNRQYQIFSALRSNHQLNLSKISRKNSLTLIYCKNLLKRSFHSLHSYKFIRLSHSQALQAIQQKIINPKQISVGFSKICERKQKIEASNKIFQKLKKIKMKSIFYLCFHQHVEFIRKFKQIEKRNELQKLESLFTFLKKNQQFNRAKVEEIRNDVVLRLAQRFFINNLRMQSKFSQRQRNLHYFVKQQKQTNFIDVLKTRRQQVEKLQEKSYCLSKFLGLSYFGKKIVEYKEDKNEFESKTQKIQQFLCVSKLDTFIKSLNRVKSYSLQMQAKSVELSVILTKKRLKQFVAKINYERKHNQKLIQQKTQEIVVRVNFQSFFTKFSYQARRSYLSRWADWTRKSSIFEKLQSHMQFRKNQCLLTQKLQKCRLANAWGQIKENLQRENEVIFEKFQQLRDFLENKRKVQLASVTTKFSSVKQTQQSYSRLTKSIKLKYFSKFMRNSLVLRYQTVKSYCAIKSYARNVIICDNNKLKQRSFNGLRMMLMRLRDKENRMKTEQELMVKVDRVMYQSRKSNKLTETIQRFNSSMRKEGVLR